MSTLKCGYYILINFFHLWFFKYVIGYINKIGLQIHEVFKKFRGESEKKCVLQIHNIKKRK